MNGLDKCAWCGILGCREAACVLRISLQGAIAELRDVTAERDALVNAACGGDDVPERIMATMAIGLLDGPHKHHRLSQSIARLLIAAAAANEAERTRGVLMDGLNLSIKLRDMRDRVHALASDLEHRGDDDAAAALREAVKS